MPVFYCKFKIAGWGNTYHRIVADTEADAIRNMTRGTKLNRTHVHVWKGHGIPKIIAGKTWREDSIRGKK